LELGYRDDKHVGARTMSKKDKRPEGWINPDSPYWPSKKGKRPEGWPNFDIHLGCDGWPMCEEDGSDGSQGVDVGDDCCDPNPWDWVEDDDPKKIAHLKEQEEGR
jgi:hypothetical protein